MKSAYLDDLCNDQLGWNFMDDGIGIVAPQNSDNDDQCNKRTKQNVVEERRRLVAQQDREYITSLEADKKKRQQLMEEEEKVKRQAALMEARRARVPEEPCEGDEKVRVRHITQGIMERAFSLNAFMTVSADKNNFLN